MNKITKPGRIAWKKGESPNIGSETEVLARGGTVVFMGSLHGEPIDGSIYVWGRGEGTTGWRLRMAWAGNSTETSGWSGGTAAARHQLKETLYGWEALEASKQGVVL